MEQEKRVGMLVFPVIDSQNPPITADSVILGESGTGAVRLSCFAGDAYVLREEEVEQKGERIKKVWLRPVCVLDIGNNAVEYIESYLLYRLSTSVQELKAAQEKYPEIMRKIYEELQQNYGNHI